MEQHVFFFMSTLEFLYLNSYFKKLFTSCLNKVWTSENISSIFKKNDTLK